MALIRSSVKLITREHATYRFSGPALTLGVPDIYATYAELQEWFRSPEGGRCTVIPTDVALASKEPGRTLGWVSAQTFFKVFGIASVVSVDIPGCEHTPDFIYDLNNPLPLDFVNRFNLVIDPGTTEHVFDIKTALANIVYALKVGGVVIQQVPVYSYNGGYYSINPNVLNDFYTANGFTELKTYIILWDRYHAYTGENRCYEYSRSLLGERHALADYDQCRLSPHMLFFGRKTRELSGIVCPLQFAGPYMPLGVPGGQPQASTPLLVSPFLRNSLARIYQLLPYSVAFYFHAWARRAIQLYKIRRHSFWM